MTREHSAHIRQEWFGDCNEDITEADDINESVRISSNRMRRWPRKEIVITDSASLVEEIIPITVVDEDNDENIDESN